MKNKHFILGQGDLTDRLSIANIKIALLESKIRNEKLSDKERGKISLQIRQINDNERIPLRNALNILGGKDYWEDKIK